MIVEYIGLTQEGSALIEGFRQNPAETKAGIITRVLSTLRASAKVESADEFLDLGQGAKVRIGEKLMLFLSSGAKRGNKPDAFAEARPDGLYMDGIKFEGSRNGDSPLHPAMLKVQERKNHRNEKGGIISLSAFRQWYVVRNGGFVRVDELKDPALSRKRGRTLTSNLNAEELGL